MEKRYIYGYSLGDGSRDIAFTDVPSTMLLYDIKLLYKKMET